MVLTVAEKCCDFAALAFASHDDVLHKDQVTPLEVLDRFLAGAAPVLTVHIVVYQHYRHLIVVVFC